MQNADVETLSAVEGIGEVIASAYVDYMEDGDNRQKITHLMKELTIEKPQVDAGGQTLTGMVFVITGSLLHYENRNELKDVIEQKGGKVTGSVTGKTTCLINNDSTSNSTKNKKAKELNVPVLTEDEFIEQYLNA